MIDLTISKVAQIVGGKLMIQSGFTDQKISQIVTDSRIFFTEGKSLFFALIGPRNNGHSYVPELINKGFKTFVISDSSVSRNDATFILVENTKSALQKLAAFNRQAFDFPVIGITGSNGKTIIKEWLPGDNLYDNAVFIPGDLPAGEYDVQIAIVDSWNYEPRVKLAIEGRGEDGWYQLGEIKITE